jgi:hypothetical protein
MLLCHSCFLVLQTGSVGGGGAVLQVFEPVESTEMARFVPDTKFTIAHVSNFYYNAKIKSTIYDSVEYKRTW